MKILLIGEFSSLHSNLKKGLELQGHIVHIASLGDSWKNIPRDIDFNSTIPGPIGGVIKRLKMIYKLWNLKDYDVVQLINPFCLFNIPIFTKLILKRLKLRNRKMFFLVAGTDSYFIKYSTRMLKYSPIQDELIYDLKLKKHPYDNYRFIKLNDFMVNLVDGIIPIMYEYSVPYLGCDKLCECIPIPMDIDEIKYKKNIIKDKIVVFHGLNRYGFKGTKYVEDAFCQLKEQYKDVDFIIDGKLPLDEYLDLMKRTNIIIDQTSSYSNGVNAIYALAMGKIVLGGAEPESLDAFNYKYSSPVFNITPSSDSIIKQLKVLLDNPNDFERLGSNSRKHVEDIHDYKKVSQKYITVWSGFF